MKIPFFYKHKCFSLFSALTISLTLPGVFLAHPAFSSTLQPTPLILVDDGSPDGMPAWDYMLQNPKFSVKAMAVTYGESHPAIFGNNVMRMLTQLGITGIPVAVGSSTPLAGNNAFPEAFITDSDIFYAPYVTLPNTALESVDKRSAAQLIVDTINQSPVPVDILNTGALTDVAKALALDPGIAKKIGRIQIMGGAIYVPGNLSEDPDPLPGQNKVSEFNIWVDPVAAEQVFSSGIPLYEMPLDATNKIGFTRADQAAWKATGTPESIMASQLLDYDLSVVSGNNPNIPNPLWDLVAAINLSHPSFCPEVPLHIEVNTTGSPYVNQGQTLATPGQPNVNVCLNPSFANLSFSSSKLFSAELQSVPENESVLGLFIASAFGAILLRKRSIGF